MLKPEPNERGRVARAAEPSVKKTEQSVDVAKFLSDPAAAAEREEMLASVVAALSLLSEHLGIRRCRIMRLGERNDDPAILLAEWRKDGRSSRRRISFSSSGGILKALKSNRSACRDTTSAPSARGSRRAAARDREWRALGVAPADSAMAVPALCQGMVKGCVLAEFRRMPPETRAHAESILRTAGSLTACAMRAGAEAAAFRSAAASLSGKSFSARAKESIDILISACPLASILVDREGHILAFNGIAQKGAPPGRSFAVGQVIYGYFRPEVAERRKEAVRMVIKNKRSLRFRDGHEGRRFNSLLTPIVSASGEVESVAIFAEDITERLAMESELTRISELERQRLGHILHDTVGQHLTGIGFLVMALKKRVEELDPALAGRCEEISRLTSDTTGQVRHVIRGLTPVHVDAHGLGAAIERMALDTSSIFGIKCLFSADDNHGVASNEIATQVFWIAREAMHNAVRHAGCTEILVSLAVRDGEGTLTVADNGNGMDRASPESAPGMGMRIMGYRASLISADLRISPGRDCGTVVTCVFPADAGGYAQDLHDDPPRRKSSGRRATRPRSHRQR